MEKEQIKQLAKKYQGRILGLLLGFIFAVLWVTIGFAKALAVLIIMGLAYVIGAYFDGDLDIDSWLAFFNIR